MRKHKTHKKNVQTNLAQKIRPLNIRIHTLLKVLLRRVFKRLHRQDPRVSDQDVDPAEAVHRLLDQVLDIAYLARVALHGEDLVLAVFGNDGFGCDGVGAVGYGDLSPGADQGRRDGGADAFGAAGYEGGFGGEGHGALVLRWEVWEICWGVGCKDGIDDSMRKLRGMDVSWIS